MIPRTLDHDYVTLEPLDVRAFATSDPRGFLAQYPGPAVLDEVQRAPELFSYLQEELDRDPAPTWSSLGIASSSVGAVGCGRADHSLATPTTRKRWRM